MYDRTGMLLKHRIARLAIGGVFLRSDASGADPMTRPKRGANRN